MKTISTTEARKNIAKLVDMAHNKGGVFAIGRRNKPEAILIGFPREYNEKYDEITNLNAMSKSFDFLKDEPDLYTLADAKEIYVKR